MDLQKSWGELIGRKNNAPVDSVGLAPFQCTYPPDSTYYTSPTLSLSHNIRKLMPFLLTGLVVDASLYWQTNLVQ